MKSTPVVFKAWLPNKQHQHYQGTCHKCAFLGPTPDPRNQMVCGWSPAIFRSPPGGSDGCWSLSITVLEISRPGWILKLVHKGKRLNAPNSEMLIYSSGIFANIRRTNWNEGITDTLLQARTYLKKKKKDLHQIKVHQICLETCMIPSLYVAWLGQALVEDLRGIGRDRIASAFSIE